VSLEEDAPDYDLDDFVDARQGPVDEFFDTQQIPFPEPSSRFCFSHVPPASVIGSRRWPGIRDSQSYSASSSSPALTLVDVWALVQSFLDSSDRQCLSRVASAFSLGVICSPLWLTRPWQPHRRRRYGFGSVSLERSATTDKPTIIHVFHHLWPFLSPCDRHQMQRSSLFLLRYSYQRVHATVTSVAVLRAPRPPPTKPKSINQHRTRLFGSALLRFDFIYGDLVRWLAGEYTNRHRNWTETFHLLQAPTRRGHPRGLPPTDFPRAQRIATAGVPLVGDFVSHPPELQARVKYDNHPKINENQADVDAKFAAEEQKSFHIILPKFFVFFIIGLFLNPLQWAIRKGKGRICVDCTNGPDPIGSPNHSIPKPSATNADACPPVYYGNSFSRFLILLWSMREAKPLIDILLHCDDLDAAFRRVLYHPDLAVVFAYIFMDFLIVPVGQVFGSRSAPSYFSLMSDVRAEVASTTDLVADGGPLEPLALSAILEPLPADWDPASALTPVCPDALHPPLSPAELLCFANATFVDDNGVAGYRDQMRTALHQSVRAAYILFGFPHEDRRQSCLSDDKWDPFVSHIMLYLGFLIDSRAMTVTWPLDKRVELRDLMLSVLRTKGHVSTPRIIASIIGKLRSAARVAPWGNYMSFSSQEALTAALRKAANQAKWFWRQGKMRVPAETIRDFRVMVAALDLPEFHPTWTRPIALLIPRTATHTFLSDASYGGLGGWSPEFGIMWRVMRQDLLLYGFPMKLIDTAGEPIDFDNAGLHINPLEFLAIILNIWIALKLLADQPHLATGYIVTLLSDNTSAISWLRTAGKCQDPGVRRLARLASSLLIRACTLTTLFQSCHIPGKQNDEADCLSRLVQKSVPSWDYVTTLCSRLQTCRICLLPPELLSTAAAILLSPPTEDTYEDVTTSLLKLELLILPLGSRPLGLQSTISL
jgi:hypothetical protein